MFSVTKSVNEENYIDKVSDVKASSQFLDKYLIMMQSFFKYAF